MEIDGGDGGDRAKWAPPGAGRREGAVVEARVASMVAQSEAVMATGVALVMGSGIAAMAVAGVQQFCGTVRVRGWRCRAAMGAMK